MLSFPWNSNPILPSQICDPELFSESGSPALLGAGVNPGLEGADPAHSLCKLGLADFCQTPDSIVLIPLLTELS